MAIRVEGDEIGGFDRGTHWKADILAAGDGGLWMHKKGSDGSPGNPQPRRMNCNIYFHFPVRTKSGDTPYLL